MLQLLASVLFFIVFSQLFVVLSIYLWKTIYDYSKHGKEKRADKPPPDIEQDNHDIKLHISDGLIHVNRLPEEQAKEKE